MSILSFRFVMNNIAFSSLIFSSGISKDIPSTWLVEVLIPFTFCRLLRAPRSVMTSFMVMWLSHVTLLETSPFLFSFSATDPGWGEGYLTKFNTGRIRPEVHPLTLLYGTLAEKEPLLYTFYWKKVPLSHTYFRKSCSHFHEGLNK